MQKQHGGVEKQLRDWGNKIARLRRAAGYSSQAAFGAQFDPPVHQTTVGRWEAGEIEPSLAHKFEMARILEVAPGYIFDLPVNPVEAA